MQGVKQANVTKAESKVLIKNMVRISVSSICYFRDLFPENCFKKKQYGSVQIHQLQGAKKGDDGDISVYDRDAFLLTQWLEKGVFEALEKEFLQSMLFAIYCKHPKSGEDVLIESYEFRVTYPSQEDGGMKLNNVPLSKDSVKNQAAKFIRSLTEFTSTLEELPKERWLTIQLKYTDSTPDDYEPEYFCSTENTLLSEANNFPLVVNIGQIKTPDMDFKIKFAGLDAIFFDVAPCISREVDEQKKKREEQIHMESEKENHISHLNGKEKNVFKGKVKGKQSEEEDEFSSEKILVSGMNSMDVIESRSDIFEVVKDYVLKTKCTIVSICSNDLKLKQEDVRATMNQLVGEGILIQKGRKFALNEDKNEESQFKIGSQIGFKQYRFSQIHSIDEDIEEIEEISQMKSEDIDETQLEPISTTFIRSLKRSQDSIEEDSEDKENKRSRARIVAELNEMIPVSQCSDSENSKSWKTSTIKEPVVLDRFKRHMIY